MPSISYNKRGTTRPFNDGVSVSRLRSPPTRMYPEAPHPSSPGKPSRLNDTPKRGRLGGDATADSSAFDMRRRPPHEISRPHTRREMPGVSGDSVLGASQSGGEMEPPRRAKLRQRRGTIFKPNPRELLGPIAALLPSTVSVENYIDFDELMTLHDRESVGRANREAIREQISHHPDSVAVFGVSLHQVLLYSAEPTPTGYLPIVMAECIDELTSRQVRGIFSRPLPEPEREHMLDLIQFYDSAEADFGRMSNYTRLAEEWYASILRLITMYVRALPEPILLSSSLVNTIFEWCVNAPQPQNKGPDPIFEIARKLLMLLPTANISLFAGLMTFLNGQAGDPVSDAEISRVFEGPVFGKTAVGKGVMVWFLRWWDDISMGLLSADMLQPLAPLNGTTGLATSAFVDRPEPRRDGSVPDIGLQRPNVPSVKGTSGIPAEQFERGPQSVDGGELELSVPSLSTTPSESPSVTSQGSCRSESSSLALTERLLEYTGPSKSHRSKLHEPSPQPLDLGYNSSTSNAPYSSRPSMNDSESNSGATDSEGPSGRFDASDAEQCGLQCNNNEGGLLQQLAVAHSRIVDLEAELEKSGKVLRDAISERFDMRVQLENLEKKTEVADQMRKQMGDAVRERDEALGERDAALKEKDGAVARLDKARKMMGID
ncbi:hypothetical protein FISHEDRAFT_57941 [Fistulina hepatica ATCC 64428]|uniref:Rho-GAP domain-containing protein n=1 Tax=Fistulina hepatica ATCC 64428 TaxID=1128425 RepID=A0A0D7AEA6_9AGAR|nr:hypothetical protein FISHEDRAFT_57941 [Fistulina hepatica ATCC 64428]